MDDGRTRRQHEEIEPLPAHGGSRARDNEQGSTATSKNRGTEYIIGRLKRDRPDLAQRVVDGDLTANAAAIEAGFRRRLVQVPADDVDAAMKTLLRHFSPSEILEAAEKNAGVTRVEVDIPPVRPALTKSLFQAPPLRAVN